MDWPTAARLGRTFALIEAFDGAAFHDATFDQQWGGAGAAGLVKFAYLFWRADQDDAVQLRAWNLFLHPLLQVNDGVALDCEEESGTTGDVTGRVLAVLGGLTMYLGVRPLFYSSPTWIAEHLTPDPRLAEYGLWLAAWQHVIPDPVPPWPFVAFWQDGAASDVPCTGQPADRDWFLGPINRLHLYGKQP